MIIITECLNCEVTNSMYVHFTAIASDTTDDGGLSDAEIISISSIFGALLGVIILAVITVVGWYVVHKYRSNNSSKLLHSTNV